MHSSAKLNLFFGVPNLGAEMLPGHLAYLTSFMARRPMNAFFPVSIAAGTIVSTWLFLSAIAEEASGFGVAGYAMLGSLMALAVVEHWFLVVPVDGNALWKAFRRRGADGSRETAMRVERELVLSQAVSQASRMKGFASWAAGAPIRRSSATCATSNVCSTDRRRQVRGRRQRAGVREDRGGLGLLRIEGGAGADGRACASQTEEASGDRQGPGIRSGAAQGGFRRLRSRRVKECVRRVSCWVRTGTNGICISPARCSA